MTELAEQRDRSWWLAFAEGACLVVFAAVWIAALIAYLVVAFAEFGWGLGRDLVDKID